MIKPNKKIGLDASTIFTLGATLYKYIMGIIKKSLFLLFLATCNQSFTNAQIEKWVDEHGKTHYGSRAPSGSSGQNVKTSTLQSSQSRIKKESVILYSTSWCPHCKKARAYLEKNSITYTEYDIEKDSLAKQRYEKAGGKGVPFIVKGRESLAGFTAGNYDHFFKQ